LLDLINGQDKIDISQGGILKRDRGLLQGVMKRNCEEGVVKRKSEERW
jgi:hypothetical protein